MGHLPDPSRNQAACAIPCLSILCSLCLLYCLDIDSLVYLLPGLEEIDCFFYRPVSYSHTAYHNHVRIPH